MKAPDAEETTAERVAEGLRLAEGIKDPALKAELLELINRIPEDDRKYQEALAALNRFNAACDKAILELEEGRRRQDRYMPVFLNTLRAIAFFALVLAAPPLVVGLFTGETWFPPTTFRRGSVSLVADPMSFYIRMTVLFIASGIAAAAVVQLSAAIRRLPARPPAATPIVTTLPDASALAEPTASRGMTVRAVLFTGCSILFLLILAFLAFYDVARALDSDAMRIGWRRPKLYLRSEDAGAFYFWVMFKLCVGSLLSALSVGALMLLRSKRGRASLAVQHAADMRNRYPSGLRPLWIALVVVMFLVLLYGAYGT